MERSCLPVSWRRVVLLLLPLLGGCVLEREIYRETWAPGGSYVVDEVVYGGGPVLHGGVPGPGTWNYGYDPFWYLASPVLTAYGYVPSYYATYAGYPFYIDYFWHYPVYATVSRPWVHVYRPRYPLYSPPVHRPPSRPEHRPGLGAAASEAVRLANRPPGRLSRRSGEAAPLPRRSTGASASAAAGEATRFAGGGRETKGSVRRSVGAWQPVSGPATAAPSRSVGPRRDRPQLGIPLPAARPASSPGPRQRGSLPVRQPPRPGTSAATRTALPRPAPRVSSPSLSRGLPASAAPRARPAPGPRSSPPPPLSRPAARPAPSRAVPARPPVGGPSRSPVSRSAIPSRTGSHRHSAPANPAVGSRPQRPRHH